MSGYSGKPLWQKLGFTPEAAVCVQAPVPHLDALLTGAPDWVAVHDNAALVLQFCQRRADLHQTRALAAVAPGGAVWFCWPKKRSALYVDLAEDDLRRVILPTGWVDVKVCAVDADWSGLKFLKRRTHG